MTTPKNQTESTRNFAIRFRVKGYKWSGSDLLPIPHNGWAYVERGEYGPSASLEKSHSSRIEGEGIYPKNLLRFESKETAKKFIEAWEGHPYYYKPNKLKKRQWYEIFEVEPVFELVTGYRKVEDELERCKECGAVYCYCEDV